LDQLERHLADCPSDAALGPAPVARAQFVQGRGGNASRCVARNAVALIDRDVELVTLFVLKQQVFPLDTLRFHSYETGELADAVIDVHHVFSRLEAGREGTCLACSAGTGASCLLAEAEDLKIGPDRGFAPVPAPTRCQI